MQVFLRTRRLVLRRFTDADLDDLVALDADPAVMRFLTGGRSTPRDHVQDVVLPGFREWYARSDAFGYWAAIERSTGQFVGWFEFRPVGGRPDGDVELGYRLKRDAWGKGYATGGARALVRKGFTEFGVRRVVATTMAVNVPSRRVMEKVGLRLVRAWRQDWPDPIEGNEHGDVEYALTKAEWERWEAAGTGPPDAGA